ELPRAAGAEPAQRPPFRERVGEGLERRARLVGGLVPRSKRDTRPRALRIAGEHASEGERSRARAALLEEPRAALLAADERDARRGLQQRGHQRLFDEPRPPRERPDATDGLLPADQHLLHAAGMNRRLKEERTRIREAREEFLQRTRLGER